MVDWLAGKRIKGTSSERTTGTWTRFPSSAVGGWVELGRSTLQSAGDTMEVTGLANKKYLMLLSRRIASGNMQVQPTFNGDTQTNYSYRRINDGGSDLTSGINKNYIANYNGWNTTEFNVAYVSNTLNSDKLLIGHTVSDRGASAPSRNECYGKWTGSSVISSIETNNTETGNLDTDSELVVLGWDPSDTHTTNFWEELASVNATGSTATFNTGTFTAKKYLWIQCWYKASGGGLNAGLQVGNNSISSSSYSWRSNQNGSEGTGSGSSIILDSGTTDSGETGFANIFVMNKSNTRKYFIIDQISEIASSAGTPPNRRQTVGQWDNTSDQINIVGLYDAGTGGNFTSSSLIKVWGSN